jgi:hypothetical protein
MPPPLAEPVGPLAVPLLSLTLVCRSVSTPMFARPPPWTGEEPVVVVAVRWLPMTVLSVIVIRPNAAVPMAPAAAVAVPPGAVAVTRL